ncbi:MAG: DUF1349 domain-containing protein [Bacteroidota bacterium]|nr:DUF1349 domain-containing protein [Bacteroidota bacterium]
MRINYRLLCITTIFSAFVCFSLNSFAQKPVIKNNHKEKYETFSGFKSMDVGSVNKAGSATGNNGTIEITASGADIWGAKDAFHFCYKTIKGDFDISAQVSSVTETNLYTKAGFMARADLDENSQHLFYLVFPTTVARHNNNGGCEFQYRLEKGGQMKAIYPDPATAGHQFDVAFPNTWIRLKRQGDVFESFMSSDGRDWKLYSSFTVKLPAELMVGLALTSHDKNGVATAKFASVKIKK